MKKPFHPILLAAFPTLFLFSHNAGAAPPSELILPIALSILLVAAVWLPLAFFWKSPGKGAIVASAAVLLCFTFALRRQWLEHFLSYLSTFWASRDVHVPVFLMLGFDFTFLLLLGWTVARMKGEALRSTRTLNVFAAILFGLSALQAGPAIVASVRSSSQGGIAKRRTDAVIPLSAPGGHKPDIYYIILDGFGREDVLKQYYAYDSSPFLTALENKGFYVAKKARANYCQTPLCMSSSLNSRYLDDPSLGKPASLADLGELIGRNIVSRSLKPLGYKYVTFATGFDPTDHPETDVYLSPYAHVTEFQRMLLGATPATEIFSPNRGNEFRQLRGRTLHVLDKLPGIADDPDPTFTFAHIVCPHPPFVFGEGGEDVSPYNKSFVFHDGKVLHLDADSEQDFIRGYRRQVVFLVDRVSKVIDEILARSPEPPIILLQSDHGPALNLNIHSLEQTDLHERMSILNAYYVPEAARKALYPEITPVNSFRVVFNALFEAKLPLLPDRSFFSIWEEPFQYIDVTQTLNDDARKRDAPPSPTGTPEGTRDAAPQADRH